jgi:hypothetical protein
VPLCRVRLHGPDLLARVADGRDLGALQAHLLLDYDQGRLAVALRVPDIGHELDLFTGRGDRPPPQSRRGSSRPLRASLTGPPGPQPKTCEKRRYQDSQAKSFRSPFGRVIIVGVGVSEY